MTKFRYFLFIFFLLSSFFTHSVLHAAPLTNGTPAAWHEGAFAISAQTEAFSTNANYDDSRGSFQRLTGDSKLTTYESRVQARYGWSSRLSVFSGLGFNSVRALDPAQEKTNSAIHEAFGGVSYLAWKKWFRLIPEAQFSLTLDKTVPGQTVPLTSDGVSYFRFGTSVFKKAGRTTLSGHVGLHYPIEGLAKLLLFDFSAELPTSKGLILGAGLGGHESLIGDTSTYTQRANTTSLANAGSQRFWAYSPALLEARGWIGLQATPDIVVRVGYARTLNGIRTAAGQSVLLSGLFNFPSPSHTSRSEAAERARRPYSKGLKTFEETKPGSPSNDDFQADDSPLDANELDETEKLLEKRQ